VFPSKNREPTFIPLGDKNVSTLTSTIIFVMLISPNLIVPKFIKTLPGVAYEKEAAKAAPKEAAPKKVTPVRKKAAAPKKAAPKKAFFNPLTQIRH